MTVTGCPPLVPDFSTNSFSGPNCTPLGPLTVMQSIPPGTPLSGGQTVLIVHVCDAAGNCRDCDVILDAVPTGGNPIINCPRDRVLLTCSNSAIAYFTASAIGNSGPIVCTPPSGSSFPVNTSTLVTCIATNNCGGFASCSFAITVKPQHPRWLCYWMAIGLQATPLGQAQLTSIPNLGSSGQDGVFVDNLGSSGQDGVRLDLGTARKFTFNTVLDFTAPEGTRVDIGLPPDPVNPNTGPLMSFIRKSGPKGYCVKTAKFTDDPSAEYRTTAVGTNGDLFSSFTESANLDTYVPLNIFNQPGVTSVLMTVTLDCTTHEVSLEFPDCIWTPDAARKGWDGCIYGNSPPSKPVKKTAALILKPVTIDPLPPITTLDLRSTSASGLVFDDPSITTMGRKWGDGHVTRMKAYDDGEEGIQFSSFGLGGGVHVDLGHSESFNLKLQRFQDGDIPTQDDLLTRTIGPIRGLTNRPPPPFLDALLLHATSDGIECSADFSNIGSPTAHVLVYNQGVLVAERTGVLAALGEPVLILPDWPLTLGKLGGRVSCRSGTTKLGTIRLPGGGGGAGLFSPAGAADETVVGDEFRILAELPPDAPHPDYYSQFEFEASDGPTWQVSGLQRTLACPPAAAVIATGPDGIVVTWSDGNSRLQGAESVAGPWFDLGADSPVSLAPGHPARFFRLLCD